MPLSEADTRAKLIDPALRAVGWEEDQLRREVRINRGGLFLIGDKAQNRAPLIADYLLYWKGVPIAVIEAKDESHHPASGLQQAKNYATLWDVSFAYSSNGKGFVEFDFLSNVERALANSDFPSPLELVGRLQATDRLPKTVGHPITQPYRHSIGREPRYYQDVAVRRALSAIDSGRTRLLLALATGTGKTYIASQLIWKLYQAKRVRRVLFLTDRIFLRDQAFNEFAFFNGANGDPRYVIEDELSPHRDVYFGIYQSLYSMRDGNHLFKQLPRDFFDMVVVDECHRSGFGTWREILDYFGSATQLGLTATPKRTDNVDTYAYFGDSIYSYSLGQGIGDGYLATYKVHRVRTNLDQSGGVDVGEALIAGADLFVPEGAAVRDFYAVGEFEKRIVLPDWTERICAHLGEILASSNPLEKTLVFCVNMDHALEVRGHLQRRFAYLGYPNYAVRIVSEEPQAAALLEEFRDVHNRTPVVVTTVDLLSTGVDIPVVRNIVFIRPIGSVVMFKQIVGRGTRLEPVTGKNWFRIIDYTNSTRLFDDWDKPHVDEAELPAKPWTGVLRLEVLDSSDLSRIPGAWAIAVAAPNEQVRFKSEGDALVARQLPQLAIEVYVGAPGFRDRTMRLPALAEADAELAVVELRRVTEQVERLILRGVEVEIASEVVLTVDAAGRQMTIAQYLAYAKGVVAQQLPADEPVLRDQWLEDSTRRDLVRGLEGEGVHLSLIADLEQVHGADGYDVLRHLSASEPLIQRTERAQAFLNYNWNWLHSLTPSQAQAVGELLDAYRDGGIEQLRRQVLQLDRFKPFGGAVGVIKAFGGSARFDEVVTELRARLYAQRAVAA